MVLAELGSKISNALHKLNRATVINDDVIKEVLKDITLALLQADVNVNYCKKLRDNIQTQFKLMEDSNANVRKMIQQAVVKELTNLLDCDRKPYVPKKGKPNIIMFVGLQGSGKTTTCTKYAFYMQQRGWRTALVCADTFRAGAFDQLKQNATKVRVPFYGSYTETVRILSNWFECFDQDPVSIAEEGVNHFIEEGYEIIIVDTSGRHKQENALFEEMKQVEASIHPNEILFVVDSSIGQACYDQALAFRKAVNVGSVIITKLDGHAKGGGALSAVSATESPIVFIGSGEHFDQFEQFEANSFIKRLLGFGDINKLFDTVKEAVNFEDQNAIMEHFSQGLLTLRDLQSQFHSILKLGSLNSFMSMIPGVGSNLLPQGNEKESVNRIKKFLNILDSMTSAELDGKVQIKDFVETRIRRIALGSGTSIQIVSELLAEYKKLWELFRKFGKAGLGKGNEMMQMAKNPSQMMKRMQNVIDPKMAQQLGGMGNIMQMMKEMGGRDDMQDMVKQFKKKK